MSVPSQSVSHLVVGRENRGCLYVSSVFLILFGAELIFYENSIINCCDLQIKQRKL